MRCRASHSADSPNEIKWSPVERRWGDVAVGAQDGCKAVRSGNGSVFMGRLGDGSGSWKLGDEDKVLEFTRRKVYQHPVRGEGKNCNLLEHRIVAGIRRNRVSSCTKP